MLLYEKKKKIKLLYLDASLNSTCFSYFLLGGGGEGSFVQLPHDYSENVKTGE